MPPCDRYRRKALECVRTVERMHDPAERAAVLEIAKAFMSLARHAADGDDYGTPHRASEYRPERRPAGA